MKSAIRSILTACIVCLGTGSMHAQTSFVPQGMSYQGFLTDESGNPVANAAPENRNVEFRVYAQATGGTALWGEAQTVTVFKGNFSVVLGNGSALSGIPSGPENFANLFTAADSDNRFFGITPEGNAEFSPRQRILTSAYAYRSRIAESVTQTTGFSIFPEIRSTGAVKLTGTGPGNIIELGSGLSGKSLHAGKIAYQGWSNGLDIVGAGNSDNSRLITMWAEGGTEFKGPITFGSRLGQHINLHGTQYGAGIQAFTLYHRSPVNFAWFANGSHHDGTFNPGTGGTHLATLNASGFDLKSGVFTGNASGLTNLPPATSANNFSVTGTQNFGSRLGQHLNLWGTAYAIGVQDSTLYQRVDTLARFSWYAGGTHSATSNDPGTGGTVLATLNHERMDINRPVRITGTLDVSSGTAQRIIMAHRYFRFLSTGIADINEPSTQPISINASHDILCLSLRVFSDDRIKSIEGTSKSKEDLKTLSALEVTDYTMKDTILHGDVKHKMLIAQQVEEVYPQAVSRKTGIVPDIFKKASSVNGLIAVEGKLPADLTVGDKVRLLLSESEVLTKITTITDEGFTVEDSIEDGDIFVYGREVDDLRTVDYDAIAMLNVSATQELLRRLEAQEQLIERLQQEKSEISKEVTHLRAASSQQDERLTRLESLIRNAQPATAQQEPVTTVAR